MSLSAKELSASRERLSVVELVTCIVHPYFLIPKYYRVIVIGYIQTLM